MKVKLTRKVTFSSGHRYWLNSLSKEENRALFGKWASPYSHGHNYVLEVTCAGIPDERTGMVVNIKTIDDVIRSEIIEEFDGRSINDEIPAFSSRAPSLENLAVYIKDRLFALPLGAELTALRLEEAPTLWVYLEEKRDWKMTLTRSYEFAASHRLYSPALSDEENDDLFGKCANPAGHGHNYILEVTVSGPVDEQTGMMVDLKKLDEHIHERVVDRYDHKNLNVDLPEFEGKMTTTENVVGQIWKELDGHLPAKLEKVRLLETARNIFEVSAE